MSDRQAVDLEKLSVLLMQTEAMLIIQRGKLSRMEALVAERDRRPAVHERRTAQYAALAEEITLMDNVAQQLRASGVIPK